MRTALAILGLAVAVIVGTASPAQAAEDRLCGWSGDVAPLIAKADRRVMRIDFTKDVTEAFGPGATVSQVTRLELGLSSPDPGAAKPTDATALTVNRVVYRLTVTLPGGDSEIASVQLRYRGLCYRTAVFAARSWVGTIGFDEPSVSASQALRLAEKFRRTHSAAFPLDNPLAGMQLMRATTRPPDFGKQRWFVDYETAPGVYQVLAVYMNGRVKVALR